MSDSHPLDVARALRAVPGNADPDQVGRVVAATLASTIATRRESASSLALRLFRASNEGKLPHPDLQSMAQRAWDELGLAEDGIGGRTPNEVIDEMTAVLVSVAAGRRPVHEYGCRASDE